MSYDSYWKDTLLELLVKRDSSISIQEISLATRIFRDDIQKTLVEKLKVVKWHSGDHEYKVDLSEPILKKFMSKVRLLRQPFERTCCIPVFQIACCVCPRLCNFRGMQKQIDPKSVFVGQCDPKKLHWTPFLG